MSNKFRYVTYKLPRCLSSNEEGGEHLPGIEFVENPSQCQEKALSDDSFTIRHIKQGGTGAIQTWPAAEVFLDYLVRHGGLLSEHPFCKASVSGSDHSRGTQQQVGGDVATTSKVLDLRIVPSSNRAYESSFSANILELGGGSGYLSVGLSLALNHENRLAASNHGACISDIEGREKTPSSPLPLVEPRVRIMCTDNDRATIKNMRHNIVNQKSPKTFVKVSKTVRVEPLVWRDDVGGEKFSTAVESFFRSQNGKIGTLVPAQLCPVGDQGVEETTNADPLRLFTHLIASEVHYGGTTLEPLSSVIAAVKLRNPSIIVIMLLRERTSGSVSMLKSRIEQKVERGLTEMSNCAGLLQGFAVSVRDVLHNKVTEMKMVEC